MSDVIDFVEDVGGAIVDVVEGVGGAIIDVVDWVVDEVVDPVMTTVSNVIDAALDDPIKTIAQIAAIATKQYWMLPLIEGADVAIAGGDIGDVLEATAKAYVTQAVGNYVGQAAGSFTGDAIGTAASEGTKKIITDAVSSGVRNATVAIVQGKDPLKALVTGGVTAGVAAGLGQIDGFGDFAKKNPAAAQAISSGLGAALSGGDVSQAAVMGAIAGAGIVKDIIKGFDPENGTPNAKMTPQQTAIVTDVLMNTTNAALTGGSPSAAIRGALLNAGTKALGDMVKGGFSETTTRASTAYDQVAKNAGLIEKNQSDQEEVVLNFNNLKSQLDTRIEHHQTLANTANNAIATYNANKTQANYDAAMAAKGVADSYVTTLNKDYAEFFRPTLDTYSTSLKTLQGEQTKLTTGYTESMDGFKNAIDNLTAALDPVFFTSNRAIVEALNPEFKGDEYIKANGLSPGEDPYEHFLSKGQFEGLPTNTAQAKALGQTEPQAVVGKPTSTVPADQVFDGRDYSSTAAAQQAATRMGKEYFTDSSGATYKILTQPDVKNQIKSSATFGEAFAAARRAFGPGQNFEWTNPETGKTGTFTTQTKGEATAAANAGSLVKVNQQVIDYTVNKILPNITDYKNFNPADLTEKEYAQFIGSYLNATNAQRQLMLKGADKATYGVIANVLKEAPDMIKQGANAPTSPVVGLGAMKASDYTNYLQVIKTAGTTAAADFAGLATRGLTWANQVAGNDGAVALLESVQTGLADKKDTAMSKLVGNEKVVAGGLASGIESAAAWMIGGPIMSVASMGAVAANNSWIEGSTAVIDARGYAYKNAAEARANGVNTFRALTTSENAQRTALMTSLEIAGEAVGVPGMSKLMKGIPIGGTAGDIANAVKNSALGAGQEVLSEIATTTLQMASDKIKSFGLGQNATWGDYQQAVQDTTLATLVAVGASGSMSTVRSNLITAAQVEATNRDLRANVTPITYNTVVAKTKNGEDVTYVELLMSHQVADLGSDSLSQEFANLTPVIPLNAYVSFNGADRVAMGDLFADVQAVADTNKMDGSYVAEVMRTQGFKPSDETVLQFVGKPASPTTFTSIKTYVNENTFTPQEVIAEAAKQGFTLTEAEAKQYAGQGNVAERIERLPVEIAVNKAFANLKIPPSLSKADVVSSIAEYMELNPGIRIEDVSREIRNATEGLATSEEVGAALQNLHSELTDIVGQKSTRPTQEAANIALKIAVKRLPFDAKYDWDGDGQVTSSDAINFHKAYLGKPTSVPPVEATGLTQPTGLYKELADMQANVLDRVAANEAAGLTRDQATQKAVADLATELGTTNEAVLKRIGSPASVGADGKPVAATGIYASLAAELEGVQTIVLAKIAESEAAGLTRDQATQKAVADLATELGTTKETVLKQIGSPASVGADGKPVAATGVYAALASGLASVEKNLLDKIAENEAAGLTRDQATQKAVADVAAELGTTKADVLKQIGATETNLNTKITDLQTQVTADVKAVETNLLAKIAENEAAGLTRDQATQKAIADVATELGTSTADILKQIGATETTLTAKIADLQTQVTADVKAVETNLLAKIAENEAAGMTREQATQKAVADLATELGTTKADVLKQLGTTETTLNTKIADLQTKVTEDVKAVETNLLAKIAANEAAGLTRDQATQKAVADLAIELGTTKEALLTQLGTTEANLGTKIADVSTDLQTKYDALTAEQKALATQLTNQGVDLTTAIATAKGEVQAQIGDLQNVVGRGTQQATQSDLDVVINLLQTQGAYDARYDYNGDRVIDQKDKTAIETYLRSQQPGYVQGDGDDPFTYNPAAGSKWAPTGVFKTMADEAEATRQAQAAEAERTRNAAARNAANQAKLGNVNSLMQMLGQAGDVGGQQVTVKPADPAKIGYIYDFNSIFANPSQEKMFASPYGGYAQGGTVDEVNDELLKLLKG